MNVYFRKEKIIENNTGYDMSNTVKDCIFEEDEEYGPCSASCGGGTQEKGIEVLQDPEDGLWNGNPIDAIQCPPTQNRPCNEQPCPINCEGDWGPWLPCQKDDGTPAKCGGGKRLRSYNITQPAVDGYIDGVLTPGTACPYNNDDIQEEDCNVKPCPIDCELSDWGKWNFDKSLGEKKRFRTITTEPKHGGNPCEALTDTKPYPVDCEFHEWSEWSDDIDNNGKQIRTREIKTEPKNGGIPCADVGAQIQRQDIQPINCEGKWGADYCDGSTKKRKYKILKHPNITGKQCPSSPKNMGHCIKYCADNHWFWGCKRWAYRL